MKKPIIIMSLFTTLFGAKAQNHNFKVLTPSEFKTQIQSDSIQLVDVRTPLEFNSGHINGAINIDFYSGKFNIQFEKLDKQKPLYLYCRSGSRSRQVAHKLLEMGFNEVFDLEGGYLKWEK